MATTYLAQHAAQVRTASGIDALAGVWLIVAPFVLNYAANGGSIANDIVVGIAVLLFSGTQMVGENYRISAPSWINVILGMWLIVTPFVLNYATGSAAMWNDIVMGVIVAGLGLTSALMVPTEEAEV